MIVPYQYLLASALVATVVNGHGYMTKPNVKFTATAGDPTQYVATIQASASGFKGAFNGKPSDNVADFTKAFGASKYKSLKEYVEDKAKITVTGATLECGSCDPDQTPQPVPKTVEWSHSDSEGFTASHEGPCEVWCDGTRAFQDDNCPAHFTMIPAELPYEQSKCTGASRLTFYWMAMHSDTWQVYVNCAPLEGGQPNDYGSIVTCYPIIAVQSVNGCPINPFQSIDGCPINPFQSIDGCPINPVGNHRSYNGHKRCI
ncbi:hypothetical protein JM16_008573 [Phytophthora kernoviae]|uniref:Uncharacterized protein n=1 Tax=Phytophthora kernoviae TaxID=325452 RepID=A0A8T0LL32_9STRA|nr:hypothetical protein JM16_008573 [Phytophthora kernoviae]